MLSDLARHCIMVTVLCVSLIVMAICIVLIEQLGGVEHARNDRRLSVCLFVNGSYRRALNELNLAFYPRYTTVNLFVVSSAPLDESVWQHGRHQHVTRIPKYDGSDCLVVLSDTMEVSPVFSFWFLRACGRSVVSGGEAGLALSRSAWERYDGKKNTAAGVMEFILQRNLTVVFPEFLGKGYTFVRSRRQNPILPEQPPKLARGLDADFFAAG